MDKDPTNDVRIGKGRKQFAFILTCVWIDKKKTLILKVEALFFSPA